MFNSLKRLARQVNLNGPDDIALAISTLCCSEAYKANLCDFYHHYAKYYGIQWTKPRYSRDHKPINVPLEAKVDLIIAHASKRYALIYSLMKYHGLRPVEVSNITLRDYDREKGTISIFTAKHGNPRIIKLKENVEAMFKEYISKHNFELEDKIFPTSGVISNTYGRLRTSLAKKLKDPELWKIRLYDLRHYYASMLYHRTKDILLVKESLGHKNINNTMVYTHLIAFNDKDEWICKTAKTVEEASKLIEIGFDYVTEIEGVKLFRKRK